jgi:hypothetical protein
MMPLIPTGDLTPALSATDALPDSGRWNQSQVIEAHQMMRWLTESVSALDYPVSRVSSNAARAPAFRYSTRKSQYAMQDASLPLPTQLTSGRARCFCAAEIDTVAARLHTQAGWSAAPDRSRRPQGAMDLRAGSPATERRTGSRPLRGAPSGKASTATRS